MAAQRVAGMTRIKTLETSESKTNDAGFGAEDADSEERLFRKIKLQMSFGR